MMTMHMYSDLASWWPLLSAPADYAEEADYFRGLIESAADGSPPTLLELGSGGGNLASHLRPHFRLTLSDRSREMLEVSRGLNPDVEHNEGDMRTLRLGREFDAVLIHDAIMYITEAAELQQTLATAAVHCRTGGTVVIAPDCVRETFNPETVSGGHDGPDGRALRYLEWTWDPDAADTQFETLYAIVLRESDGSSRVQLDRHIEGMFSRTEWLAWLAAAGLPARVVTDPWDRDVFVAIKEPGR
ncbi:MAG: class I SAM-dependent methyltransferase [Gemmatimonadaceae bacterium]